MAGVCVDGIEFCLQQRNVLLEAEDIPVCITQYLEGLGNTGGTAHSIPNGASTGRCGQGCGLVTLGVQPTLFLMGLAQVGVVMGLAW